MGKEWGWGCGVDMKYPRIGAIPSCVHACVHVILSFFDPTTFPSVKVLVLCSRETAKTGRTE